MGTEERVLETVERPRLSQAEASRDVRVVLRVDCYGFSSTLTELMQ